MIPDVSARLLYVYMMLGEFYDVLCTSRRESRKGLVEFCEDLVAFLWGWGLTNCASYATLALLTRTGGVYKTLNIRTRDLYKTLITSFIRP